jgi:putative transposase
MARFEVPDGMVVQAFQFTLDLTGKQASMVRRQFGGRRYAYNWTVRTMKADITAFHADGAEAPAPSMIGLRKRWNQAKDTECVDAATGEVWWPEVSKEAFADGIAGAVDAYWNWQKSRAGNREGRRMGFPRFKKKGRDHDRITFTTGAIRAEPDRRHVTLPRIGTVRTHENTRRLERLITKGRARILAATVSRKGTRIVVAFRILLTRPQQPHAARPDSTVGVDVGVRVLATVGVPDGTILERIPNPRALEAALPSHHRVTRLPSDPGQAHPAAPPGRGHPRTPHPQPDHQTRQDPRHHRGRRTGCGGDAPPKRAHRSQGQTPWPLRCRPGRTAEATGLQNQLVRLPTRRGRPLVPIVQTVSLVRAQAGHWLGRALDLRPMRDQAPA